MNDKCEQRRLESEFSIGSDVTWYIWSNTSLLISDVHIGAIRDDTSDSVV